MLKPLSEHIVSAFFFERKSDMIGREKERRILRGMADSGEAELVVVYGRRRVGKTYLVNETFPEGFSFKYTGIANITAAEQRREFQKVLRAYGWTGDAEIGNWFDAFDALRSLVGQSDGSGRRILLFFDEMPWMDNKHSDFVPALENFWNGWACTMKSIMLIICGSAASWITKRIFRNKGGLYNRTTRQIHLLPFTLAECHALAQSRDILMNAHELIESYMIFGGIPYYLRMLERGYGFAQNVDEMCFAEGAPLRTEFNRLFDSLFSSPEKYVEVVEAINAQKRGIDRERIAQSVSFGNGGNLTRILAELEASGFIRRYKPYGKARRGALYQLVDPFAAFHLDFLRTVDNPHYWSSFTGNARYHAWSGYAFEQVCLAHVEGIKRALGVSGVLSDVSAWRSSSSHERGAQVDLVIDRNDQVINLCEMKYSREPYALDKDDDLVMRNKVAAFRAETRTRKSLHLTLVTTYGLRPGKYNSVFQRIVTMDDLI
jgi:hypothetical protein